MNNSKPLKIKAREKLEKDSDLLIDQIREIDDNCPKDQSSLTICDNFMLKVENAILEVTELIKYT